MSAFFRLAAQPCWCDFDYVPREAGAMLANDERVGRASLLEVRAMLTYAVRTERFSDGMWGHLIETGRVTMLLQRLAKLQGRARPAPRPEQP